MSLEQKFGNKTGNGGLGAAGWLGRVTQWRKKFAEQSNLANDVDGTHEQLVEMPTLHEIRVAHDGQLEHGPDLHLHLRLNPEQAAQEVQTKVGEVVHLTEEEGEAPGSTLGSGRVSFRTRI